MRLDPCGAGPGLSDLRDRVGGSMVGTGCLNGGQQWLNGGLYG